MADGFQGAGYFDANGQWRSYGTTINSTDPNTAGFQPDSNYNPDQATGWNARPTNMAEPPIDPGPAFGVNTVHAGGPVATRPITTPSSSRGTPAFQAPSASTIDQQPINRFTTPRSSSGLVSSGPPTINPVSGFRTNSPVMPGGLPIGGALGTGVGALSAAPSSQADIEYRLNHPLTATDLWNTTKGWFTANPQNAPAAAPQTQTQPMPSRVATATPPPPINLPPFNVPPPPPGNLPPFVRGPIPAAMPQHTPVQRAGAPNLGYGVPGAQSAAAPQAPSPMFTTIDRPNADVAGGPSRAGQLAPQYFNQAREPGGPAQMGALDLSGLFNHPAVAQAAAAHSMARAPVQGPLSALAPQRAPMMQASPFVYPRTNAPSPSKDINAVPLRKSYNPFQLFGTPT